MALSKAERTRRDYKPDDIRVFIGESPPVGGDFFYYANSACDYATREAFQAAIPALRKRDDFLSVFCALGCYLEDLSPVPVNHLDLSDREQRAERRALRRKSAKALGRRMRRGHPRSSRRSSSTWSAAATSTRRCDRRATITSSAPICHSLAATETATSRN
jgi:hypothetical protein